MTASLEVDLERRAHGGLDVHDLDVLPVLLKKRGEEVGGELGVQQDLLLGLADVADRDVEAHNLLHLELNRGLDVDQGLLEAAGGDEGRELTGLGEARTEQTRDLLDESVRRDEAVVLRGELLDQLLVLVELLQLLHRHVGALDALGLLAMDRVTEDADLHVGARHGRQLEGAAEALVALRVIVLKRNLQLDRLDEVALLALKLLTLLGDGATLRKAEDVVNRLDDEVLLKLRHAVPSLLPPRRRCGEYRR
mmetsp:Transcript_24524/g.56601  ORF Transcript_24524/g.56601 Transcript_24524/m.56601 type:complete len:251 (-) Transcript_24524:48-800(-)